ncbi:MAG: BREX-3 system phosphatase PglZ [Clostridia bacterium]|nr:BREX-3 system phosphatase PglZ [Clostridia bacterium]
MRSWRDQILREFTPKVAKLTLVADPDGLLLEEGILEGIRERGFELIPFEDHVAFRYAYESRFRSRWDCGAQTELVVVLHSPASDLGSLPYDLLQAGRRLSFNLGNIFPNLSYPVVAALDRGDLDALYEAQQRYEPGRLGDNATKEFVLRHLFEIAPELIKQPSDLMRVLLRRHYRDQRIPVVLDERFIQLLRQNRVFDDWPLEIIVPDREVFFAFVQERWPVFLDRMAAGDDDTWEDRGSFGLTFSGPEDLPFEHHDIRVYMDNLFLEGILQSVPHKRAEILSGTWAGIGIRTDSTGERGHRLNRLIENIQSSIPAEDARHGEWFHFARGWAELAVLAHDPESATHEEGTQQMKDLQPQVDAAFAAWLARRYAGLINLPPVPPVMLHHIPRFLARHLGDDRNTKVALLLVDGLSADQWIIVREALSLRQPNLRYRENTVFGWVPAITAVSRQALFAGKPPVFFPNSIHTTDREPVLWRQFWVDQGLLSHKVVYARGLGDGSLEQVEELIARPKTRVAGLVIDKVDKIMHGMELGTAGMHNQVRQWAHQPYLADLLDLLLDRGFRVFLTSDHGNIEAGGCGSPAEGAIADLRGERVRIYSDALLRDKVQERFPSALKWPPVGLPEDYLALLAPDRKAFIREGERLVSHGGITIEELIVPFIQIERRNV